MATSKQNQVKDTKQTGQQASPPSVDSRETASQPVLSQIALSPHTGTAAVSPHPHDVLHWQRTIGNQAINRWLKPPATPNRPHSQPLPETQEKQAALLQRAPGNNNEEKAQAKEKFPWIGQVRGPTPALRKTPKKDPKRPYHNIIADLTEGDWVDVIGRKGGWLHVRATVNGKDVEGYVSQELIAFNRYDFDPLSLREALVVLKRAETAKKADKVWKPNEDEKDKLEESLTLVKGEKKYQVDEVTYVVTFVREKGSKIKVETIEDFVLFVEAVEAQYPSAGVKEVIGEVRQLWFSDENWEVLLASEGIKEGDKYVDIETKPNPIAEMFDMADLAPKSDRKVISTPMGDVDIGHVLTGIDARLSGSPAEYPEKYLKARGHDGILSKVKYEKLKEYSDGDPTAFATFAGDLGQAYAIYLYERYDKGDKSAKLWSYMRSFASPEELLGDIHGYIAAAVAADTRDSGESPTGKATKASSILRDMYLVDKSSSGATYFEYLEKVSGKKDKELKRYIYNTSMSFAHTWYAKLVASDNMEIWLPGDLFDEYARDFSEKADRHENSAAKEETLEGIVSEFMTSAWNKLR